MNSRNKRFIFGIVVVAMVLLAVLWWHQGSKSEPLQLVPSQKPASTSGTKPLITASPQSLLRYDEGNDPRLNQEAGTRYYQRREQMIRARHGDAQIDNILKGLRSGKDLGRWLGRVQTHEVVNALPIVAGLLANDDKLVRRVAAETLCQFGDRRWIFYARLWQALGSPTPSIAP